MVAAPPPSRAGSLVHRPSLEQGYAGAGGTRHHHRHHAAVASAGCSFGPSAPAMELRPRRSSSCSHDARGQDGHNSPPHEEEEEENEEVLKPHTGMTIRLTPELLGRFKEPGPKPKMELVLKSAEEGELLVVTPPSQKYHRMITSFD